MKKLSWVVIAVFILLGTAHTNCPAKKINENAGTSAAQILKISVGAEAVGMGESCVAIADDVYATYWNPAGLSQVGVDQLGFMHNEWFQDIRYEFMGYVHPISDSTAIAFSTSYISLGELDRTDETGSVLGQFHPYDILFGLSFGKRLNDALSFGVSAKFLQEQIDDKNARALAADIGGLYSVPGSNLILGANVQHLGTRMKFVDDSFALPLNLKVGAAYRMINGALTLVADVNRPVDNDMSVAMGVEYKLLGVVNLRTGYRYAMGGNDLGAASGLRAGFGVDIADYSLDYAFVPYGELGQSHRISLLASF